MKNKKRYVYIIYIYFFFLIRLLLFFRNKDTGGTDFYSTRNYGPEINYYLNLPDVVVESAQLRFIIDKTAVVSIFPNRYDKTLFLFFREKSIIARTNYRVSSRVFLFRLRDKYSNTRISKLLS